MRGSVTAFHDEQVFSILSILKNISVALPPQKPMVKMGPLFLASTLSKVSAPLTQQVERKAASKHNEILKVISNTH